MRRTDQGLIALGGQHSCAVIDGGVKCWGSNQYGQVGDGTNDQRPLPTNVKAAATGDALLSGVTALAAGYGHTCALLTDTTVKCWGWNSLGQLGNGETNADSSTPVVVEGLSGVTAIAVGNQHSCALLADTTVKCWGNNSYGQLGNRSTQDSLNPVTVKAAATGNEALSNVVAIVAGDNHTCALLLTGSVKCWGYNNFGQLGDGSNQQNSSSPADVVLGSSTATALAAGHSHTCALLSTVTVKCWGWNQNGQLGNGLTVNSSTPVDVAGLTDITSITGGSDHTCAINTRTEMKCWGSNGSGQLGDGNKPNSQLTPVNVTSPATISSNSLLTSESAAFTGARAITLGNRHSCAIVETKVFCWGFNVNGQLGNGESGYLPPTEPGGDGENLTSDTPVEVVGVNIPVTPEPEQNQTPAPAVTTTVAPTTTVKAKVKKADTLPATGSSTSAVAMFGVLLLAGGAIIAARKRILH